MTSCRLFVHAARDGEIPYSSPTGRDDVRMHPAVFLRNFHLSGRHLDNAQQCGPGFRVDEESTVAIRDRRYNKLRSILYIMEVKREGLDVPDSGGVGTLTMFRRNSDKQRGYLFHTDYNPQEIMVG